MAWPANGGASAWIRASHDADMTRMHIKCSDLPPHPRLGGEGCACSIGLRKAPPSPHIFHTQSLGIWDARTARRWVLANAACLRSEERGAWRWPAQRNFFARLENLRASYAPKQNNLVAGILRHLQPQSLRKISRYIASLPFSALWF